MNRSYLRLSNNGRDRYLRALKSSGRAIPRPNREPAARRIVSSPSDAGAKPPKLKALTALHNASRELLVRTVATRIYRVTGENEDAWGHGEEWERT